VARDVHAPLRSAIEAAAQRDPERVALAGGGETRTYGELALLLDGDGDSRRQVRTVSPSVAAAEAILRDSLRGDSLLLLDGKTTAEEAE
jgi:hypothetical protein